MNGSFFSVVGSRVLLRLVTIALGFWFSVFYSSLALGQNIECPAKHERFDAVDFSADKCREIILSEYVMSAKSVWLALTIELDPEALHTQKPLGLFISGNLSTHAYLNGHYIGSKGIASLYENKESPGPFDWLGFVDRTKINEGENTLVLFASSHSNLYANQGHFNRLYIGNYVSTTDAYNKHYALTYIPLGAMLIALAYLLIQRENYSSKRLILLVILAIIQLVVEVSRGYYQYPYYLHEVRLFAIALCSFLFGQCLLMYSLRGLAKLKLLSVVILSSTITLAAQLAVEDFDYKAIIAIQIPASIALFVLIALRLKLIKPFAQSGTAFLVIILASLFIVTVFSQTDFLDSYFYFFITFILFALTVAEANYKFCLEQALLNTKEQAEQLKLALALSSEHETARAIKIKSAGQIAVVPIANILFCKAAGDYVELICKDQTVLYSGSLVQVSEELAAGFLKVHRSFLVNAKCIKELKRLQSGNGELLLTDGHRVPVSRTLFSAVRTEVKKL